MVVEIWNHYKNRKDGSPEQCTQKRETRSNKHKPREHCMSYSWWILMVADRNCSKTVPPNKYMAHIFCLLDLQDDPMFSWSEYILCNLPTGGILLLFSPQESCKWMWWSLGQCRVGRSLCWTGRTRSENNFGSWNTIKSSLLDMSSWGAVFNILKTLLPSRGKLLIRLCTRCWWRKVSSRPNLNLKHRRLNHKMCRGLFKNWTRG